MKKLTLLFLLAVSCCTWSCKENDNDDIWLELDQIKQELAELKSQISSLQTIVEALNGGKFITNVTEGVDSHTITFSDGRTITIKNGKNGTDAPALGIDLFEGSYYWILGGKGNWLTDASGNKMPVSGQDGVTPRPDVDADGYWTVDGVRIVGADGQPVKATGKDGDSFFKKVEQTDDEVIFTLSNGGEIRIPKAKELNFVIEKTAVVLKYGASRALAVTQRGVLDYAISKPDGWRASLDGDVLTITAPVKENTFAEAEGKVSVVAVGATATVVATVEVKASDAVFEDNSAGGSSWTEW